MLCLVFFAISLNTYAVTFWLPSLVGRIEGLSDFGIGLVSAIPWICAVITMYLLARFTDRRGTRTPYVSIALIVAALGTFLSTFGSPWWGVAAMCIAAIGFKGAASVFWPVAQQGMDTKIVAAGIALVNSLGNLGGFVAPTAFGFVEQITGSTSLALNGLSVASLIAAGLAMLIGRVGKSGAADAETLASSTR